MDPGTAAILGSLGGAAIAGPVGYLFQRFMGRPRVNVEYAEVAYEDVVSLTPSVAENIGRYASFVAFVESQVKWHFIQRIHGNLFKREELRILQELGAHFLAYQRGILARVSRDMDTLQSGKPTDLQRLAAELSSDYGGVYGSHLPHDLQTSPDPTKQKLVNLLQHAKLQIEVASGWLDDFLKEVETFLDAKKGTSNRIVIRAGVANQGQQDGIVGSEATLLQEDRRYRLPIQLASRPWEGDSAGPSRYHVLGPKSFKVLEFVVDERLNASADVDSLRERLATGTTLEFRLLGIGEKNVAARTFTGRL